MKITVEEVEHVARLARLTFTEEEKKLYTQQLNTILLYIDKLNELDTKDIEPTSHAIRLKNAFRDDEVKKSISQESSLANAPQKDKGSFVVPKVI
ncbi:MAG TPA: Asp-tRNA(Asn)/Glu-tRNA(Gln) amidotransferase subunit GatC, partial [Syntrophaceae bacterium]|nr:Asp-tRNA(Asn)/Glu-tRNA(Gln) amidotransferase subunit GatC [Syntrophaceae bacterium]